MMLRIYKYGEINMTVLYLPPEVKKKHINRFKNAFSTIFKDLNFNKITTENNIKKDIFRKGQQDVSISDLSSGKKQIVFRGAFLLRNQQSTKVNIVLLDEPEISLHPKWQDKIFDYYCNLFIIATDIQNSQLFIAIHSQYALISGTRNRNNTSIILLERTANGLEIKNNRTFTSITFHHNCGTKLCCVWNCIKRLSHKTLRNFTTQSCSVSGEGRMLC